MVPRAGTSRLPIHPLLIVIPHGLWVLSLLFDLLYLGLGAGIWSRLALYVMVGGFIGTLAAVVVPGFSDLAALADRRVKRVDLAHVNLSLAVMGLYAANIWLRVSDPAYLAFAVVLSALAVSLLAVCSWLDVLPESR